MSRKLLSVWEQVGKQSQHGEGLAVAVDFVLAGGKRPLRCTGWFADRNLPTGRCGAVGCPRGCRWCWSGRAQEMCPRPLHTGHRREEVQR